MEKRTFGIILTIPGILGLVLAGINFLKGGSGLIILNRSSLSEY